MAIENANAAPDPHHDRVEGALAEHGAVLLPVEQVVVADHVPAQEHEGQRHPGAYAIGAGLAWLNVIAAFVCYGCIALYFVFPHAVKSTRRS